MAPRGVPAIRIRALNTAPPAAGGAYVLYWMVAARRTRRNAALDRALEWARDLRRPLLVFEPLRCDYRWASARFHRFVVDGMIDNRAALAAAGHAYYPYVERRPGDARGLIDALAARAAVVVTDRAPVFFIDRMLERAAPRLPVRLEAVDGNGLLPIDAAAPSQIFPTAYAFRRFLQRTLPDHLAAQPHADPLRRRLPWPRAAVPRDVLARWRSADDLLDDPAGVSRLPIDQAVGPAGVRGGARAADARLRTFVGAELARYADDHSHPDADVTTRLSPYLHFGHIAACDVAARLLATDGWTPSRIARRADGKKAGWWGAPAPVEALLDELVTWRELGFNMSARRSDADTFASLPPWAIRTLRAHAGDRRPHVYTADDLAAARTHDPLWNAAQRQLLVEGRIHNYLRMLWGKKILEWTRAPEEALEVMFELNNRYALDGRDPNSTSGICWVLGRYDRPWAPERPIFGSVRYMSSANTARKLRVREYLRRYGA